MTRKATPAQARAAATAIVRRLRGSGHTAYFAGGCVRDELLGLSPTDYDVATDATPDRIRALFKRTQEVGVAFGVVLVTPTREEGGETPATVEVATFRSDGPYSDRRRPDSITFSDPQSDARRRDFTINALFIDPLAPPDAAAPAPPGHAPPRGHVIDYVGGLPDLDRRVLRAVGDPEARLAEDHLRALRAVRFAARLGFQLDPATAAAIRAHARELTGVSRERIGEEARKMLNHPAAARAVRSLEELGLDGPVLDGLHTDSHSRSLEGVGQADVPTALAAWALDRGLNPADPAASRALITQWTRALCLSNEERAAMVAVLANLGALETGWDEWSVARQKRLAGAAGPAFADALRLLQTRDPVRAQSVRARVAELAGTPSGLAPPPFITGDDLVAMGLAPGQGFKTILDRAYDAQLEGSIRTREQAIDLARELGRGMGV
jgi:poly(A) polymerase